MVGEQYGETTTLLKGHEGLANMVFLYYLCIDQSSDTLDLSLYLKKRSLKSLNYSPQAIGRHKIFKFR